MLLTYGSGKNDIVYVDKGSGGLDEFKTYLTEDKIFYGILEVVVKGIHPLPLLSFSYKCRSEIYIKGMSTTQ